MTINAEICKHLSHAVYGDNLSSLIPKGYNKIAVRRSGTA